MSGVPIRVLLADDHPIVRTGLRAVLSTERTSTWWPRRPRRKRPSSGPAAVTAQGLSNQAIGGRLHLTEGTVKSHLARVYTKLGVDSRTAAVATATALGLIRR